MTTWAALLAPALVGTERHTGAWPPSGAWTSDVNALVAQVADTPARATGLLRAAAVVAVAQGAAEFGLPFDQALPAAAADDTRDTRDTRNTRVPAKAEPAQQWLLHEGPTRTQHELLAVIAARGQVLPHAWLPTALDLGRRHIALREPLGAVLGTRGAWLAAQRDEWHWATGSDAADDETHWHEGNLEQRTAVLRRQRTHDAPGARQRLAEALPELPANERATLLATLEQGLSSHDESLLEQSLSDSSREVRQAAASLLLRLPGSAFTHRAIAVVAPLLRQERPFITRRWVIEPPAQVGAVEPPRPAHEALGDRAWWLYQAARQVPLAWWTQHTGMTPAQLITWAEDSDWTEALHRAWRDVLFSAPDPAWCSAVVHHWPRGAGRDERAAVLAWLPPAERDSHWQHRLERDGLSDELLAQLDPGCQPPQHLSAPLSRALADALRVRLDTRPLAHDWLLREALLPVAGLLHPDALSALHALPRRDDDPPSVTELLHNAQRVATARAHFYPRMPP